MPDRRRGTGSLLKHRLPGPYPRQSGSQIPLPLFEDDLSRRGRETLLEPSRKPRILLQPGLFVGGVVSRSPRLLGLGHPERLPGVAELAPLLSQRGFGWSAGLAIPGERSEGFHDPA